MKNKRRNFIKLAGMMGIGIAGDLFNSFAEEIADHKTINSSTSIIGAYGPWAAGLIADKLPSLSWRRKEYTELGFWKKLARQRLTERLAISNIGNLPKVTVKKQYVYDGLHIEEMSWQLPYGPPTDAIVLKPEGATGRLP